MRVGIFNIKDQKGVDASARQATSNPISDLQSRSLFDQAGSAANQFPNDPEMQQFYNDFFTLYNSNAFSSGQDSSSSSDFGGFGGFTSRGKHSYKNVSYDISDLNVGSNYADALGARESGGNYQAVNKFGYMGKYQMGKDVLIDLGYMRKDGSWTGKDGIKSQQDFLNNPKVQDKAQQDLMKVQWGYIKSKGLDKYVGQEINGVKLTQSSLIAAAHLKGVGSLEKYLKSSGAVNQRDGFGTSVHDYVSKFSGFDVNT